MFEFNSTEAAKDWQAKKYGQENWQQHYIYDEQGDLAIYDSLQMTKRIVFYKNFWRTASTVSETNDHLLFFAKVLESVKNNKK